MIALQKMNPTVTRLGRPSFLQAALVMVSDWQERRRQRRALLALTPELLKDIGLDPAEAWREGMKPFWKA